MTDGLISPRPGDSIEDLRGEEKTSGVLTGYTSVPQGLIIDEVWATSSRSFLATHTISLSVSKAPPMPLETIHFLGLNVTYPSVVTCASSPRRLRQIRGTLLSRELYEGLMMPRLGVVSTKDSRRLLFCARGSGCTSQVRPSGMEELPGCTTTLRLVRELVQRRNLTMLQSLLL